VEQRFGNVILRDTVIRRASRAHAVRGVTAAVVTDRRATRRPSGWLQHWLQAVRRSSDRTPPRSMLTIEGPGFVWRISIGAKQHAAALAFAADVNTAARRVAA
jgi:hypothetical protein